MLKKKVSKQYIAYSLVLFQFSSLFLLMFTAPVIAETWYLFVLQIIGVFLGFWAVLVMRVGNFNVTPTPVKNGKLRIYGPYKVIRHPMYTSILIFSFPLLINSFSLWRLLIFVILLLSLLMKINFEEKNLLKQFLNYEEYRKETKKIFPFIY